MKLIANVTPLLTPLTGVGRYTYEIVSRLPQEWEQHYYYGYVSKRLPPVGLQHASGMVRSNVLLKRAVKKVLRSLPVLQRFDLYWEPNFIPLQKIKAKKIVTTVHDFSFMNPKWHPKERVEFFAKHFWQNIKRSDHIITVSHAIKTEAMELLGLPSERISVIYNGIDHATFGVLPKEKIALTARKFQLPKNFILFVGSIEPRKNLLGLLQAYDLLPRSLKEEFKLVLAGFDGWKNEEVMGLIQKNKVRYLGYVSQEELAHLYNLACLFVYPSLYEGFGIPPLEAMACGTPVIVSDIAVFKEVYADAALFCDPHNIESIANVLQKALEDERLRKKFKNKGKELAKTFSWERSAQEHSKLFKLFV